MSRLREFNLLPVLVLALLLAQGASAVHALPPCTGQLDVQPAPGAGAQLGCTVATDGTVVATGAHQDNAAAPEAGAIYVLQRGGTLRLTAADAEAGDLLGFALALEGSTLVAGAPQGNAPGAADSGVVYVFSRPGSSWTTAASQVKLAAPNARRNDQFGQAVALSGDRIAVGAPDRTGAGSLSGAVYIFKRIGASWTLEAEIADPDAAPLDGFGFALALDGDTLAVGAPFADQPGRGSVGVIHVFVREGTSWVRRARIVEPAGQNGDELGVSVALSGTTLVSGARRADVLGLVDAGAAFVFARADAAGTTWTQRAKLTATNPGADDLFGSAVAIAGSRIVVGARNHDAGGHNAGAGFVFESLTAPPLLLLGTPPEPGAALGQAVAAFGDSVVFGAHLADTGGRVDSGALLACPSPLTGPVCPATTVKKDDGTSRVNRGDTITYRIDVSDAAAGATVADDFTAILEGGVWCRGDGCTDFRPGALADTLANGGAAVYRVRGRVPQGAGGTLTNEVCVTAVGCPTVCARDTDTVASDPPPVADLFCTKTGPSSARTGDLITYVVAAGNQGGRAATGVVLDDPALAGLTFVSADPPCAPGGTSCTIGRLDGGEVRFQRLTYRVTAAGPTTLENIATATGSAVDPTPLDNTCRKSIVIEAPPPPDKADLSVVLAVPAGPLSCGAGFTFQATVSNLGPAVAKGTFVDITAPGVSGPPSCVAQGSGLRCTLGDLAPGGAQTLSFTGQAPAGTPCGAPPPSISIQAQTASTTMDPDSNNNSADETREVSCPPAAPSFAITKSDGLAAVQPGQQLLYTIVVTNTGACPATAEVEDLPPLQVEDFRWCRGAGCLPSMPSALTDAIELAPGASGVYQVSGQVSPFAAGSISNTARVLFGEEDESSATDLDAVVLPLGVTGLCAGIDGPFVGGGVITYTFVLYNGGPFAQQDNPGDEFRLQIPGLNFLNVSASSGNATLVPAMALWNGAIPVGGQVVITVVAAIPPGTGGLVFCAQGQLAFDADGNGTNESGGVTDDPDLPGNTDPCCFKVLLNVLPSIPTLAPTGMIFLILLLMIGALVRLHRR